jgi:hypothetical protein
MMEYAEFLGTKALVALPAGRDVAPEAIHPSLFPFQRDMVRYALRKGRAALFEATGLGKTRQQIEFARLSGERALIVAPLGVTRQTIREGQALDVPIVYARSQAEAATDGITITNYERIAGFDPSAFGCVVLDESAILRDFEGKTRSQLIAMFAATPYRLACSATPAPNDVAELANHAEFLGVMTRAEMLASFFVHDDQGWRLKGHARQPFYRWLASWGMSLKRPSDLGYSDEGYNLPPLVIHPLFVRTDWTPPGQLFPTSLKGIGDRAAVRRDTLADRVQATVNLIQSEPDEPWIAWCGLNDEGREIAARVPDSVLVEGADSPEAKLDALDRFTSGRARVLVTKVSIFGQGLNLQMCGRQVFCGLSDSFDAYHQALRRSWRFGRTEPVHASIVLTEPEEPIYTNVLRKERDFEAMTDELVKHVAEFERAELSTGRRHDSMPHTAPMHVPAWLKGSVHV